jgi:cystathionine beta-synthase
VVDTWQKTIDQDSMPMARRLIRDEGLLSGGSSGAVMSAAIKAAKDLKEGQRCVVLLPDGIRNYMTKMVSDSWMIARDFFTASPENAPWQVSLFLHMEFILTTKFVGGGTTLCRA